MNRRQFIQSTAALAGLASVAASCTGPKKIRGCINGASSNIGHLLRDKNFGEPSVVEKKDAVIVGGGVSGLSAAYHLRKAGLQNFCLLELEETTGGNAAFGSNSVSAFPWGAHYVPVPNNDLQDYLSFLQEANVITGYDAQGLPVYNELFLCFDPEERLYLNGQWQEGLVPAFGLEPNERKQVEEFLQRMNGFRYLKGSDGRDAFALPVNASSRDEEFLALDKLTMQSWMKQQGFTGQHLHRYVNYCTRDDFGTPHDKCSAWAGIHYFACRKGRGANASHTDVLTWPEGNGFLVKALAKDLAPHLQTGSLAVRVELKENAAIITYLDVKTNTLKAIEAKQCVLAVPHFVATRLMRDEERAQAVRQHFRYVPWMVANLTVSKLKERSGAPPAWDNVIHDSGSLGYVDATHQLVEQARFKRNLTYYLPLTDGDVHEARRKAQAARHEDWVRLVMADLQRVHPNIEVATEELNVQLWGHAMVQPQPGLIHGGLRQRLAASLNNRLHFAHTDLAGVSLFEEGFYQGLNAAQTVLKNLSA